MPLTPSWSDIAVRLAFTLLAGAVLGINRTERGRSAGLRTTILVCLAASVSMILANLLLATAGDGNTFVRLDVMRLPLGILCGMGFIGAGAIVRHGDMVSGVTTAATLWLVTVIGFCFGSGQLVVGIVTLVLAIITLWLLMLVEKRMERDQQATLVLSIRQNGPTEEEIRSRLTAAGFRVRSWAVVYKNGQRVRRRTLRWEIDWRGRDGEVKSPPFLQQLAQDPAVSGLKWEKLNSGG